ncbi:HEAT repeat domain-containing protein [Actinoplanes regularis]|uniref:HEAT repeat domain-containing protein n=1 Tax=Actinoplanes regularis TaxID=52697 RepID=UPI002557B7BB|nr:HEAT repeat domain-containing protein [Actinoplanes regularis]
MTSLDGEVRAAVRRGDVGWLSARLDAGNCPPAVMSLLVRHDQARIRHLGWILLAERVTRPRTDESESEALAGLLPVEPDGPPETALVLAGIHQRLWRFVPRQRRPRWRTADLPIRVRIAWLRAELVNEPETARHEPAGELLYQAVAGIAVDDVSDLEELVRALTDSGDPVLHTEALRLTRDGLHAALLAPARARACVGRLLATPGAHLAAALREIAEPWAALGPFPQDRLRAFVTAGATPDPAIADAVLAVAARHEHVDLLRDVVVDENAPPRSRQRALEALGVLADRGDIGELTAVAATDPLLLAGPAVVCLRAMHRRGHFPNGEDAVAIVSLALADHTIPADEAATIMFTCRRAAFDALTAAGADDGTWPRRLALLVGLAQQGGGDLPIGDAISGVLAETARPEAFLTALRALRHTAAEAAVIDVLPRAPEAALHTLEAIGGPVTVAALAARLGLPSPGDEDAEADGIAAYLRPVRNRALELLWHLTDDPEQRRTILARLAPRDLPRRIVSDLGIADQGELAILSAGFDPGEPVTALVRLAHNGDAGTVPIIADLLSRIVADLAATWQPGAPTLPTGTGRPDGPPAGEPEVPEDVVAAVHALGRRLHDRGKIRPVCLLDAADSGAAGHALVATIALDLLERPELSDPGRAILLALLRRTPYPGIRARTHRLLRHRDRHVRKHAIALLAVNGTGADVEALSASLTALTAAGDAQTVRQALLALGQVRARWAAPAIATCLDHPAMNVKKTAAEALIGAGTPAAVPKLLFWLGHHDNPGLRRALVEALRAVLGTAYAATVLAAGEQAGDERSRELLLTGLSRTLSARAVGSLVRQESPAGPTLLALVAGGRITLSAGTVEDLAAQLRAYGITGPVPIADARPDPDLSTLTRDGWSAEAALRIVDRYEGHPGPPPAAPLRPMLANWLRLADATPATRPAILRFTLAICPAPWSTDEVATFARAARTLLTGLHEADQDTLIAVLEEVAPTLPAAAAFDAIAQIRALPPAGHRSLLTLQRRLGAVLTRADVEQSLAAARLGADPWLAETGVLREAFGAATTPPSDEAKAWRHALDSAVRTPEALAAFRSRDDQEVSSRDRVNALIDAFPSAAHGARGAVLDWLETLQPVDAPRWTLAEENRPPAPAPRTPHDSDLDQPRSAALRRRLLAMLGAPARSRRETAVRALRDWPEPRARQAVLRAFLHGEVDIPLPGYLAPALAALDEAELRAMDSVRERAALLACHLDPPDLRRLIPLLVDWWAEGDPATRAAAGLALRGAPEQADALAEHLRGRLEGGAWGFLDLIVGRPLLRTPALTETCRRLRAEGRGDLADALTLVDGPLRDPEARRQDAAALAALRARPSHEPDPAAPRRELLELIRTGQPEQIRTALTQLAEAAEDDRPSHAGDDPELAEALAALLRHPERRLRLYAHRIGRRVLDRPTHLRHTALLLDDPEPDTVRSAIRALCHAAHQPAIPPIIGLLTHSNATVRKTAAAGLIHIGSPAIPALRHAAGRARPDKRHVYTAILDQLTSQTRGPS